MIPTQTQIKRAMGETGEARYAQMAYVPAVLKRLFPGSRSMLDIGCGDGRLLEGCDWLLRRVGVDSDPVAVNEARQRFYSIHPSFDDIHEPRIFDLVTMVDVCEHLDRDSMLGLIEKAVSFMSYSSVLFIQTDNPRSLLAHLTHYDDATHVKMYSERQMTAVLQCFNLHVVARGDRVMHPCKGRMMTAAVLAYRTLRYGWGSSHYERYWIAARKVSDGKA
jgi:SAM-dependent methyltransferase